MGGKILIVDDVATNRIVLKVRLTAAGYLPQLAPDGRAALGRIAADRPDLVLLDLSLPDMTGADLLARLRADPQTAGLPVIVLSAGSDKAARVAAFRAGADAFLTKPVEDQTLLARIRSLLRQKELSEGLGGLAMLGLAEAAAGYQSPGRVALITARPDLALRLRRDLGGIGGARITTMTPEEALAEGLRSGPAPDLFLIEADLSAPGSGLRLMSEVKSRANTRHCAVAILAGPGAALSGAVAFDLGASDLIAAEACAEEIALRLARLIARKREEDRLRASVQDGLRLAVIDPLTGLFNRRYGVAQLAAIAESGRERSRDFAVMVVDLDRFKAVNDHWGHAAGDAVLIEVARRLQHSLRTEDLLARIGGEEFLIALPDTGLEKAQSVAERLCRIVEQTPVPLPEGGRLTVTVSIGLAIATSACKAPVAELVNLADRALMVSKSGGRNQVTTSQTAA